MIRKLSLGTGASLGVLLLTACGASTDAEVETPDAPVAATEPVITDNLQSVAADTYGLDKTHAFLTAYVGHSGGLSSYRISLTDFDATLDFDPASPESSSLSVSINPMGVVTNYPGDYKAGHAESPFETWEEDISRNPNWMNADAFPEITFTSTAITRESDDTGTVTGDLTFLGLTQPVTLDVTYNGTANVPWLGERDLIGFDAETVIKRSDWGMDRGIPSIGDEVTITFSGEFVQAEG